MAALAQVGGRVKSAERRVRLLRLQQFWIEPQVIRLAEKDVRHGQRSFTQRVNVWSPS